jgi:hypothetical protein
MTKLLSVTDLCWSVPDGNSVRDFH